MKTRTGFVSNSSSCSFVIKRNLVTDEQIVMLERFNELAQDPAQLFSNRDHWLITVGNEAIMGTTCMDNGDMWAFMFHVGIDINEVRWEFDK